MQKCVRPKRFVDRKSRDRRSGTNLIWFGEHHLAYAYMMSNGKFEAAGAAMSGMTGGSRSLSDFTALISTLSLLCALTLWLGIRHRRARQLDLPLIPGPWKHGLPLLGNVLELIRPDFHHLALDWANQYGGIYRVKALWTEGVVVTDPAVVASICGRGDGALDKASIVYLPINQMCSPRGHPNLLTSSADPAWRAVRKAVAAAFSVQNIRKKFTVIRGCSQQLLDQLVCVSQQRTTTGQPPLTVDVDQCALRVTLDVIGMAGFGHDFGCIKPPPLVTEPAPTNHILRILPRCFTEVMLRIAIPFRSVVPGWFKFGLKGEQSFEAFQREMRTLLRKCLLRDKAPPDDDMTIGAQLWRAYYEQKPASRSPNTTNTARADHIDLAPAEVDDTGADADGQKDADDQTAGGLLPPPPTPTQRFWLRMRDVAASIMGRPVTWSASRARDEEEVLISAERILSEIGILFIEGFETTGHTISWTLFNISTTPGVQDRIASELDSLGLQVKGDKPVPPSQLEVDMLPRLTYLTACIKEAMRMLPVVSIMGREVRSKPVRVGPYLLPPHTSVAIPLFAIHNSNANWEEPHSYKPDRWLKVPVESYVVGAMPPLATAAAQADGSLHPAKENGGEHLHAGKENGDSVIRSTSRKASPAAETLLSEKPQQKQVVSPKETVSNGNGNYNGSRAVPQVRFAPFSEGPRNCVGQTLAKMEVVSFLALILGHFRVELAPEMGGRAGIRACESTHLTLQTKGTAGIRMVLHPRWDTAAA